MFFDLLLGAFEVRCTHAVMPFAERQSTKSLLDGTASTRPSYPHSGLPQRHQRPQRRNKTPRHPPMWTLFPVRQPRIQPRSLPVTCAFGFSWACSSSTLRATSKRSPRFAGQADLSAYLSVYLFIRLSVYPFVRACVRACVCVCVCACACVCVCASLCLCQSPALLCPLLAPFVYDAGNARDAFGAVCLAVDVFRCDYPQRRAAPPSHSSADGAGTVAVWRHEER